MDLSSGGCPPRSDSTGCFKPHPVAARSPPTPQGRSRQELGTMCAGRSRGALRFLSQSAGAHMQGAPPLRCRVRREGGASRGWGFEAALRRTARSPVVTRTVSHGSEPIQRGNLRGGLLVAGKAPGALPVAAGSGCHGGRLVPLDRLRDSSGLPLPCTRGTHSGLGGAPVRAEVHSLHGACLPAACGDSHLSEGHRPRRAGNPQGPGYAQPGRSVQGLSDGVPRLPDERLMRTWASY